MLIKENDTSPCSTSITIHRLETASRPSEVPIGTIVPFVYNVANDWTDDILPANWACRVAVATVDVPALRKHHGDRFRPTDAADAQKNQLFVPNLEGKFVRGHTPELDINFPALGPLNDPDAATRMPVSNGLGNGIGSCQAASTRYRNPKIVIDNFSNGKIGSTQTSGSHDLTWGDFSTVNFMITSQVHGPIVVPIGTIIAMPGSGPIDEHYWQPCNGSTANRTMYPDLAAVLGDLWGKPANAQEFFFPDLRGKFLRGADLNGAPQGDPDWQNRIPSALSGVKTGVGSKQNWATALPQVGLNLNLSYPTKVIENSAADRANILTMAPGTTYKQPDMRNFTLSADWDAETAPTNMTVGFYIRAL
ncbi:hypothetical protein FKW77_002014 [Venturia effusa]|uniref:Phage tail collar domain-containing protein n=1 Tax=Venturia effusa TaxID=50376 RepID=A0A517LGP8_9PEZI|nr:hypothetical protein FKW77_002014 [Venturia effusa]